MRTKKITHSQLISDRLLLSFNVVPTGSKSFQFVSVQVMYSQPQFPISWGIQCIMSFHFKKFLTVVANTVNNMSRPTEHTHSITVLQPFFRDHPGESVPEDNRARRQLPTLWCKGRLTEADTPTIQLGATPSGLCSDHLKFSSMGHDKNWSIKNSKR